MKSKIKKRSSFSHSIHTKLKKIKCCQNCHRQVERRYREIHHKIPVSKGGTNNQNNLMMVCPTCHTKLDEEALK